MEKRKEAGCALAASLLAGPLALPTAALEVSQAWGVEPEAAKDEVVYVKAGADGATQGLYVVNVFDTGSVQTVDDPARYTRVKNLTTTPALVQEHGAVQVSTLADQPFYYEGGMDAATPLPWDVSLTYYLDGAQIAPDELAGKSGRLRIEFAVTARGGDAEAAGLADFAESCVMQAQGTFPESAFKVEEAEGATVAHVGDNAVISYLVLPRHLVTRFYATLGFYSGTVSCLEQMTLARFLAQGYFEKHINRMRNHYRALRDKLLAALRQSPLAGKVKISGEQAGLHFLMALDTPRSEEALLQAAEGLDMRTPFVSQYYFSAPNRLPHVLVMNYSGLEEGKVAEAVARLCQAVLGEPEAAAEPPATQGRGDHT